MNKILMSGNEAIAEGAIQAGCHFYAGYPITPQNELPAYFAKRMPEVKGIFIQAESELAAINMVFGASAAGVRAMTSSSSPGISLKQEGISYLAGTELPAVIVNVMRGGPGLGNIAPSQSDYFQATRSGGHGDYHSIVLAPSTVQEAYDFMFLAFNLADKYRTPAIVLTDGMLGQMMEPIIAYRKSHIANRNDKRLALSDKQKAWALTGCKGRKPNIIRSLYLKEGDLEKFNLILQKKYKRIQEDEQRYEGLFLDEAKIILVAYGAMARITRGAVNRLREKGKKIGLIRPITLWPFPKDVFKRFLPAARLPDRQGRQGAISNKRPPSQKLRGTVLRSLGEGGRLAFLVVEMSYGQMLEDVKLAVDGKAKVGFLGRAGGGIPTEEEIINKVTALL